jgi:hypothetical protein
VIIGAVLALSACEKPQPDMTFQKVSPDFGGLQGGKTVRVLSKNLRLDIGYAVYFGELRSPQVSIENDKALLAVTPRRPKSGKVDVTVRADSGSVFVIKQGFEYIDQAGSLLDEGEPREAQVPPSEPPSEPPSTPPSGGGAQTPP